jgi:Holliday junction DNA helicase RuvA
MYHYLEGRLTIVNEQFVVLDIGGVGYKIFVSVDTREALPSTGNTVRLYIHQAIREDSNNMYGFPDETELAFFEMLLGVSGIGPRSAIGILNVARPDTLIQAIASNDTAFLTKVSGIGRKTAEKIVLELRDKLAEHKREGDEGALREESDAVEALHSLGYSVAEARNALKNIKSDGDTNARIKEALKILSGK